MNRATSAIENQRRAMEVERQAWERFARLVDAGQLSMFWFEYAEYLKERGVYSSQRVTLVRAATATAASLCGLQRKTNNDN